MAQKLLRRNNRDNVTKLLEPTSDVLAVDGSSDAYTLMTTARPATGVQSANAPEWIDITTDVAPPGGEGGSSFAHLTENTDAGSFDADWGFRIGSQLDGQPLLMAQPGELDFWRDYYNDGNAVLEIHGVNGSLHWSDGTAAPDLSLFRRPLGGIGIADTDNDGIIVSDDGTGASDNAFIDKYGFGAGGPSGGADVYLLRAAALTWFIPGNGAGLQLTSPDGLVTKTIQISNAGAVVAV